MMQAAVCILSLLCWACAQTPRLQYDLCAGTFGPGPLEFNQPSSLAASATALFVLDAGNRRIQKMDTAGKYAGETQADMQITAGRADLAAGTGDYLFLSGVAGNGLRQFDENLFEVYAYALPPGFICYDRSGYVYLCAEDQVKLGKFSLPRQTFEYLNTAPAYAGLQPLDIAYNGREIAVLTHTLLLVTNTFGKSFVSLPLPARATRGFLCAEYGTQHFTALLDTCIYRVTQNSCFLVGCIDGAVVAGGAVLFEKHLWVSDRAGNRLLRYTLP